jgi:hypothetical protein
MISVVLKTHSFTCIHIFILFFRYWYCSEVCISFHGLFWALISSPVALCVWPCKNTFLISKFSYVLFPTPPIKLKLKLGLHIGVRLLVANYLANQHSVLSFIVPFTNLCIWSKKAGKNHVAEPIWHVLTFHHPIWFCRATYAATVELL